MGFSRLKADNRQFLSYDRFMIEIKDIEKLASLARISVNDEEKQQLQKDLESILGYVSELKNAPALAGEIRESYLKNVMRDDVNHFNSGEFSEEILAEAPNRAEDYFKVKKIFN
jgi:aspartyl-tRNA(Asn)/glutamyl-tRNA(Gln) amidotransferase subunit C